MQTGRQEAFSKKNIEGKAQRKIRSDSTLGQTTKKIFPSQKFFGKHSPRTTDEGNLRNAIMKCIPLNWLFMRGEGAYITYQTMLENC